MRLLVTGANGQVGQSLQRLAADYDGYEWYFYTRAELDISDAEAVQQAMATLRPDFIVNTAAYTAVDKAESEPDQARKINVDAVAHLARAAAQTGATLIHYSSDYVYHNTVTTPLKETDSTTPQSVYAKTKLAGEQAIQAIGCNHIILRTSWVYSEYGHNFVKTMLRLAADRDQLSIVADQIGAPTYAGDLAAATIQLAEVLKDSPSVQAVFNYAGGGFTSWYHFAEAIFRKSGIPIKLQPIDTKDYPTAAERPLWSVLDMSALRDQYGIVARDWQLGLDECLRRL